MAYPRPRRTAVLYATGLDARAGDDARGRKERRRDAEARDDARPEAVRREARQDEHEVEAEQVRVRRLEHAARRVRVRRRPA